MSICTFYSMGEEILTHFGPSLPRFSQVTSKGSHWKRRDHATSFGYFPSSPCFVSSSGGIFTTSPLPDREMQSRHPTRTVFLKVLVLPKTYGNRYGSTSFLTGLDELAVTVALRLRADAAARMPNSNEASMQSSDLSTPPSMAGTTR